jgi:hypothetical protein
MAKAICVQCGIRKSAPWKKCRHCGYDPAKDEEGLVQSVYLSLGRFEDPERQQQYANELDELATEIQRGARPAFDQVELERLVKQKAEFESIPPSAPWTALFRFFLPAIGLLAVLYAILFLLRTLEQ